MSLPFLHAVIANLSFEPWMIGIIVPVLSLVLFAIVVICGMYFQHRRRQLWHETARIALEKGQPMPSPMRDPGLFGFGLPTPKPVEPGPKSRGYLIGGMMNIAVGTGLAIAFWRILPLVSYLAVIPMCIGVALLLGAWVEHRAERKAAG